MLQELIHNKINEIFAEYKEENGVIDGDIDQFDAEYLNRLEEELTDHIVRICTKLPKKIKYDKLSPSWYIYTDSEGVAHSETYGTIDMDIFFCKVSNKIAFDDITNETMQKIYFRGKEVNYVGWQPGMRFEYTDLKGNTIWIGTFKDWDH